MDKVQLRILSHEEPVPEGPIGALYQAMVHWKDDLFTRGLRADTVRGMVYVADQGCLPTGKLAKGYSAEEVDLGARKDGSHRSGRKPIIDPATAPLVVKAFEMKASGAPQAAIAKETGLFDAKSGCWENMFRSRLYMGQYEFRGVTYTDIYPALISEELFEAVQAQIPRRPGRKLKGGLPRHHPRRRRSRYVLANVAVCKQCGRPMEGKGVEGYRYYVCSQHNHSATLCPDARLVNADLVENEVLHVLMNLILRTDYLTQLLHWTTQELNSEREGLRLQIEHLRQQHAREDRRRLRMAYNFGTAERPLKTFGEILASQEDLVRRLKDEIDALEAELATRHVRAAPEEIARFTYDARALIERRDPSELRTLCERLCSRIVMGDGEIQIDLHFPPMIPLPAGDWSPQ